MSPGQVRTLARRIRQHANSIDNLLRMVPEEAYVICGHVTVSDVSTNSVHNLAASLERNAHRFGVTP